MTKEQLQAQAWLEGIKKIDSEITENERVKQRIFEDLTRCTARYTDDKVQTSKANAMENAMIAYAAAEKEMDDNTDRLISLKSQVLRVVNGIDNTVYRDLLKKHYINLKPWWVVAREMHYSETAIYDLHKQALDEVFKRL
ncbi:MAG: DUF1492 domain-containing protein [Clostridiales bacterium]|nr:DUF1492 domain-containing protein [Clostridiales bacterium]